MIITKLFLVLSISSYFSQASAAKLSVVETKMVLAHKKAAESGAFAQVTKVLQFLQSEIADVKEKETRLQLEQTQLEFFNTEFNKLIISSRPRYG